MHSPSIFLTLILLVTFSVRAYAEEKRDDRMKNRIGFYSGKMFLEMSDLLSLHYGGTAITSVEQSNRSTTPLWSKDYYGGVYLYSQSDYNNPRISTPHAGRIQAGLGITHTMEFYGAVDLRIFFAHGYSTLYPPYSWYLLSRNVSLSGIRSYRIAADTINRNYVLTKNKIPVYILATWDTGLLYHFRKSSGFDPFLQAGVGQGLEYYQNSRLEKAFVAVGARYFINKYFYVKSTLNHTAYLIRPTHNGYWLERPPHGGVLHDTRLEFGLGFSFSHPPDVPTDFLFGMSEEKKREYISIYQQLKRNPDVELRIRRKNLTIIFLEDAIFPASSYDLLDRGRRSVEKVGRILSQTHDIDIIVEGHTDSTPVIIGSVIRNNQTLSELRAAGVMKILAKTGIDRSRLDYRGYGESMPRASNKSENGRRTNRRIEIVLDGDISNIEELKPIPPW